MKKGLVALILGASILTSAPRLNAKLIAGHITHDLDKDTKITELLEWVDEFTTARIKIIGKPEEYMIDPYVGIQIFSDWGAPGILDFLLLQPIGRRVIIRNPFDNTRYCSWEWVKESNVIKFYMPEIYKGPIFRFRFYTNKHGTNIQMAQQEIKETLGLYINFDPEPYLEERIMTPYGPVERAKSPISFANMPNDKWERLIGQTTLYEKEILIAEHLSRETGKLWRFNWYMPKNIHTIRQYDKVDYEGN